MKGQKWQYVQNSQLNSIHPTPPTICLLLFLHLCCGMPKWGLSFSLSPNTGRASRQREALNNTEPMESCHTVLQLSSPTMDGNSFLFTPASASPFLNPLPILSWLPVSADSCWRRSLQLFHRFLINLLLFFQSPHAEVWMKQRVRTFQLHKNETVVRLILSLTDEITWLQSVTSQSLSGISCATCLLLWVFLLHWLSLLHRSKHRAVVTRMMEGCFPVSPVYILGKVYHQFRFLPEHRQVFYSV